jgi:hypothetical protein
MAALGITRPQTEESVAGRTLAGMGFASCPTLARRARMVCTIRPEVS